MPSADDRRLKTSSPSGFDAWQVHVPRTIRRPTVMGLGVLVIWMLCLAIWAAIAPLDGAVLASGSFVATGQNKEVQHLEGGIVRKMMVREGEIVDEGNVLVELDDTQAKAKLRRLVLRYYRLLAMQSRLEAQIRATAALELPEPLLARASDPEIKDIIERQRLELRARRDNQADKEAVLRREIAALKEAIGGYKSQTSAVEQRIALFKEELADKAALLDRQLARKTDVMALRRSEAALSGERGELMGRIADAKERMARAEQQIAEQRSAAIESSVEELRRTETELDDVQEQMNAAHDVLNRVEIKSPARGVVVKVNYHTRGAVVAPGAVILELLPINDELVIEGRISPRDIAKVKNGQTALVRLTALNHRVTPVVGGVVTYVSADSLPDQPGLGMQQPANPRQQSYVVRVRLDEKDVHAKIGDFHPTPGMPADIYIKTGERTFLEYMLRPVMDSFSRAFRES